MSLLLGNKSRLTALLSPSLQRLASKSPKAGDTPSTPFASGSPTYRSLLHRLHIHINETTPDQIESDAAQNEGLYFARQEQWEALVDRIIEADQARESTHAGVPIADLLAFGARSDVVRAAEHALLHGRPARGANFFSGVEALERVLAQYPESYAIALVVAHMHIDIGWAWRGADAEDEIDVINREAFEAHFDRASDIIHEFMGRGIDSPALLAARCALLPGQKSPELYVGRSFEALIKYDPLNARHMRAFGNYLLPRWYGDFQALDFEARCIAARTFEDWGAGAYTWVWFDALLVDPDGFSVVEVDYFLDGIRDILDRRRDQHTANLLAAHLFQSWQTVRMHNEDTGALEGIAPVLRQGFDYIITHHLREVHPLIWGHAEIGFENTARAISAERLAEQGQQTALKAVAMPFLKRLQDGHTITFGPNGITQSGN